MVAILNAEAWGRGNEEGKGAEADDQDPLVSGKECELDTEGSLLNR